eukprot:TRINITY_DN8384_c0_g1_i10.p1 TRINITY_DN8384_c0_g1~~TRINITY_DN8384_c0_g1_i10.p1  ORF type:complete len:255 (+),score=31.37 TRINITY_DN8384_c0_g1_i10:555-1319(+)
MAIAQQCEKEYDEYANSVKRKVIGESEFVMPTPEEYYRKINKILRETELDSTLCSDATKWKKIASVDLKKTLSKNIQSANSKSANEAAKKTSNSIQTRLKSTIGTASFEKLKDIFEGYSTFSGNANRMENHELQKLMRDYELHTDKTTKVSVELIFKKNNKHKNYGSLHANSSNLCCLRCIFVQNRCNRNSRSKKSCTRNCPLHRGEDIEEGADVAECGGEFIGGEVRGVVRRGQQLRLQGAAGVEERTPQLAV